MARSYKKKRERNAAGAILPKGLRVLTVRARPGHPSQGLLQAGATVFACALGRGGISADKREGDGATPLASMRILSGYFRGDQFSGGRKTRLAMTPIGPDLGWCEVPDDRNYNRPVKIPYGASHERMRRDDRLYDACLVLDWNLSPAPAWPRQRHLLPPGAPGFHADAMLRRGDGTHDGAVLAAAVGSDG